MAALWFAAGAAGSGRAGGVLSVCLGGEAGGVGCSAQVGSCGGHFVKRAGCSLNHDGTRGLSVWGAPALSAAFHPSDS